MYREYTSFLRHWRQRSNRKPLIIRGARQVGKTYLVEEFANEFDTFIKINFEENASYCQVFADMDVKNILEIISLDFGCKIVPGNTLIFLDEIQTCPEIIPALRYFYEHVPGLHVIAAGSLLDHVLNKLKQPMPVGRLEFLYMYPMTFREFLIACGHDTLVNYLDSWSVDINISEIIHHKLLKLLCTYIFVGGMPEAVKVFVDESGLLEVERVHESILATMEIDFSKYGNGIDYDNLRAILRYLPRGIGKKLKYSRIAPSLKSDAIRKAFEKLELSRIAHRVSATSSVQLPLMQFANQKDFKPLFLDIGLATHLLKIRLPDLEELMLVNEGELAEQFIGQQLLASEPFFINTELFYWRREQKDSNAELDYLVTHGSTTVPVEVKAGKTGTLKSLHVFMLEYGKNLAIRFNTDLPSITEVKTTVKMKSGNKSVAYRLLSLPLYMVNFCKPVITDHIG